MLFAATSAAQAKIDITVDKDNQMMTVAVDGVTRYHWPVSTGNPSHETPNGTLPRPSGWKRITSPRNSTTRRCRIRSSSPRRSCNSRHRIGRPAGQPGVAWLRAAVARQCLDAICAGGGARRAQHHRDADRVVAGRAGAQSARPRQHRRRAPRPRRMPMPQQYYNAAGDPVVLTPRQPAHGPVSAGADGRRLHLSGRRQPGRRALSGAAALRPAPVRRAGLSAAAAVLRQRPAIWRAAGLCAAAVSAARAVQLSGLTRETSGAPANAQFELGPRAQFMKAPAPGSVPTSPRHQRKPQRATLMPGSAGPSPPDNDLTQTRECAILG